jgi:plasmid stabilization system protein ParE
LARRELEEAALWYEEQLPGLGDAFVGELEQVFEQLSELPLSGPPFRGRLRHRPLFTFPYRVVYAVRGDDVLVLAIMHQRRGPRYMAERLGGEE